MRVMVTGAAGFIGSQLSQELVSRGFEVVGVDGLLPTLYSSDVKRANVRALAGSVRFRFLERDLREPLEPGFMRGIDAVFNLAALPGLDMSWSKFDEYISNNATVVERLSRSAIESGVAHFVQASTSSVYGRIATVDEEAPTAPFSPYGVSKLAGEQVLSAYASNFGLPFTILRYFSVYGPGQRPDMAYHIICERLLAGEEIEVFGDGTQTRSNTFISDCVAGSIAALESPPRGQIYNIAGGETIDLNRAIEVLATALGQSSRVSYNPPRAGDQLHTQGAIGKASSAIGYVPSVPVEDGLRLQASWHRAGRPASRRGATQ